MRQRPAAATETGGAPRITHVPALDGLRGVAVIAVVAFHVGHLDGGFLGVDLFFVLSGFLITSLLLAEGRGSGRIDLVRFWLRRARRLLPALGLLLIGVAAYARFAADPAELARIRGDGIATMLYVANWREVFARVDYWALFSDPSPLNHTWSLAIEEQFYLVWPLVFAGLLYRSRVEADARDELTAKALITSLVFGAASLCTALLLEWRDGWNRVYYGTDTRAFAIFLGAAVASATAHWGPVRPGAPRRRLEVAGLVAVGVLVVAWTRLGEASPLLVNGGLAVCSLAGAVVVAAASHPQEGPIAVLLSWGPLRRLGLISYGVYLYHWPVIVWLDADRTGLEGLPLIALQVGVTLVAASASYVFVEQPVRRGLDWHGPPARLVPAAAAVVVAGVVLVGTVGHRPLSAPSADTPDTTLAPAPDGLRLMVVGDSVADFLASEGIGALRATPQPALANLAVPGCQDPPTDAIRYDDGTVSDAFTESCDDGWTEHARGFRPDYVLYLTAGTAAADYRHGDEWLEPCSAEYANWVGTRMTTLAARFARSGAELVVLTTLPQGQRGRSDGAFADYLEADRCRTDAIRDAARTGDQPFRLVDLAAVYRCDDEGSCTSTVDGVVVQREDGVHFRGGSAQMLALDVLARLGVDASIVE